LTLVREIITVHSLKHTYALCGHNEEPFSFKVSGVYKGKGKVRLWVFQHLCLEGVLYSCPNEFLHSSPEALHTMRRERRKELYLNLASSPVIYMNY
jgi:hypothetical protein